MKYLPWLTLLAACSNELERPKPPDLSAVEARYAEVTGTLDGDSAPRLIEALGEKLGFLGDTEALLDLVLGVFDDIANAQPAESEGGLASRRQALGAGDIEYTAGAWGVYRRRCPGWTGDADNERGTLRMTVLFDQDGLEPVLWGGLRACRIEQGRLQVTGELAVKLEGIEQGLAEGLTGILLRFSGDYEADGLSQRVAFDARYLAGEALLTTIDLEDGQRFLVGFGFDGTVRVVDTLGAWACSEDRCSGPGGTVRF